ncbi:hypothetical protein [Rossellomorea marisflavi]|uniref:hypothetical protein n=1 Tax=Rossellomorea marisflavi TaxID=189381 RepID=UPI003459EBC6
MVSGPVSKAVNSEAYSTLKKLVLNENGSVRFNGISGDSKIGTKGTGKIPSSNTKVIELPEKTAPRTVKPQDATKKWEEFLGEGEYSNIHPIKGTSDPNRIFSADGKRSIRYGNHEMGSKPTKHHYHEEIWDYDPIEDTMTYSNTMITVPIQR